MLLTPSGTQSHHFVHLPADHQLVAYLHQAALYRLTNGLIEHPRGSAIQSRIVALETLKKNGFAWPLILDEPYPLPQPGDGPGLQYEVMTTG